MTDGSVLAGIRETRTLPETWETMLHWHRARESKIAFGYWMVIAEVTQHKPRYGTTRDDYATQGEAWAIAARWYLCSGQTCAYMADWLQERK